MKPRSELFRLVILKPSQEIVPNPLGREPGKGLYFCRTTECIDLLSSQKRLRRQYQERLNRRGSLQWMLELLHQQ